MKATLGDLRGCFKVPFGGEDALHRGGKREAAEERRMPIFIRTEKIIHSLKRTPVKITRGPFFLPMHSRELFPPARSARNAPKPRSRP